MQLIRGPQVFTSLQSLASPWQAALEETGCRGCQPSATQVARWRCRAHNAPDGAHHRLRDPGVHAVHAHDGRLVVAQPVPARRVAVPQGRRCGWCPQPVGATLQPAILKGSVARSSCRVPEVAVDDVGDVDLGKEPPLIAKTSRHCCGCGGWCRKSLGAWSRPASLRWGAQLLHNATATSSNAVQPPEMPMTALLAWACSETLGEAIGLHFQDQFTARPAALVGG